MAWDVDQGLIAQLKEQYRKERKGKKGVKSKSSSRFRPLSVCLCVDEFCCSPNSSWFISSVSLLFLCLLSLCSSGFIFLPLLSWILCRAAAAAAVTILYWFISILMSLASYKSGKTPGTLLMSVFHLCPKILHLLSSSSDFCSSLVFSSLVSPSSSLSSSSSSRTKPV